MSVLGYGELIWDYVFTRDTSGEYTLAASGGGGSVWNVLANIAAGNRLAVAVGTGGDDPLGTAARDELAATGVRMQGLRLVPKRATRPIFERLDSPVSQRFGTRCLVCNRVPPESGIAK